MFQSKHIDKFRLLIKRPVFFIGIFVISLLTLSGASYFHLASQVSSGPSEEITPSGTPVVLGNSIEATATATTTIAPAKITNKPSSSPTPTITTVQPIPVQQIAPTSTNNNSDSSTSDAYIEYLKQQEEEIQKKRETCNDLYASVTASLQPLYNERDVITQNYSEAISKGNAEKIGYYQQELSKVQSQISAAYEHYYYSLCP